MKTEVFLNLEGRRYFVGVLSSDQNDTVFQYADDFLNTRLEISPISVPLQRRTWVFNRGSFGGLPGFASDSLPDGWGNLLLHRQLVRKGERLSEFDPLRRLCWVGCQGMGALEYQPEEKFQEEFCSPDIRLDTLAENADAILADRESGVALDALASLNGSSGGARPKIVCLVSADRRTLKPGNVANNGAEPWLIKFRNSTDPADTGALEYAVSLLAKSAGIDMPETHLFESSKGAGWFGIRRFDRTSSGKMHMATAAGLLHCDFRQPCLDYQTLMALTQRLAGAGDLEQMLKRAYFNFVIDNRDDHAKNFSFLMDGKGRWRLSPAYDLVPNLGGSEHMTALSGVGKSPARSLFVRLGEDFGLSHRKAQAALAAVDESLSQWRQLAKNCGVKSPPVFAPLK